MLDGQLNSDVLINVPVGPDWKQWQGKCFRLVYIFVHTSDATSLVTHRLT